MEHIAENRRSNIKNALIASTTGNLPGLEGGEKVGQRCLRLAGGQVPPYRITETLKEDMEIVMDKDMNKCLRLYLLQMPLSDLTFSGRESEELHQTDKVLEYI